MWGWQGVPRATVPLLLIGGLPALFYAPDPLVTGDHPWMVRRLVPAVIPLLAVAASVGAAALWRLEIRVRVAALTLLPPPWRERVADLIVLPPPWRGRVGEGGIPLMLAPRGEGWARATGPLAAATLVGLGLALAVAPTSAWLRTRHAAGAVEGLADLAASLPPHAVVVFPSGPAGIHLAMPLQFVFGVDAFAVPEATLTPAMAAALARMEESGRAVYWAADAAQRPVPPPGITVHPAHTAYIRYATVDRSEVSPPLQLTLVDHQIALYRVVRTQ